MTLDKQKKRRYNKTGFDKDSNKSKKRRGNMKSTGVVRKVDELGRIVLPIEIRKTLDIKEKDSIEIFIDEDRIVLQKYQPACTFCNQVDNIVYFCNKRVCASCIEKMKEQF
jgi:transcriptional pleiotropic regulator of transition state genes